MTDHTPEEQAWTDAKLDPNPVSQPPAPDPKPRRWPWIAGIVAALLLGYGVGGVGDDVTPAAVETVEVEVPGETVVETVVETVDVTPQVCVEAIDHAYSGFDISREFAELVNEYPDLMIEAIEAAYVNSPSRLDAVTERILAMTENLNGVNADLSSLAPDWQAAATACVLLAEG